MKCNKNNRLPIRVPQNHPLSTTYNLTILLFRTTTKNNNLNSLFTFFNDFYALFLFLSGQPQCTLMQGIINPLSRSVHGCINLIFIILSILFNLFICINLVYFFVFLFNYFIYLNFTYSECNASKGLSHN